jgi:NAD(P)-dependent dehydrogenase (short-subunit alcohol dehydrogenase family)
VTLADVAVQSAAAEAERLSSEGSGSALAASLDVRDAQAAADLVRSAFDRFGSLDLIVDSAGVTVSGEPEELALEYWDRAIDVDLRGVIHGCHAAYPLMKQQGSAQILNVASTAGLWPTFGQQAPYAAAKWGVVGLSLALRTSGAHFGIKVSVLCPWAPSTRRSTTVLCQLTWRSHHHWTACLSVPSCGKGRG